MTLDLWDIKVKMASQVFQVLPDRWVTPAWRDPEDQRAVQVNLVQRDLQDSGAARVPWALEERMAFQGLEKKERKELQENLVVLDLQVLLDLWGPKVPWESTVLQGVLVLRV